MTVEVVPRSFVDRLLFSVTGSVSFFFLLSGYVLSVANLRDGQKVEAGGFFVARFARIYPLFFVILILATPTLTVKRRCRTGTAWRLGWQKRSQSFFRTCCWYRHGIQLNLSSLSSLPAGLFVARSSFIFVFLCLGCGYGDCAVFGCGYRRWLSMSEDRHWSRVGVGRI